MIVERSEFTAPCFSRKTCILNTLQKITLDSPVIDVPTFLNILAFREDPVLNGLKATQTSPPDSRLKPCSNRCINFNLDVYMYISIMRLLILTYLCLMSNSYAAEVSCSNLFNNSVAKSRIDIKLLKQRGFSTEVARRISKNRPDIVELITASSEIKAITLYRGIKTPLQDFNPKRGIWFSFEIDDAELFSNSKNIKNSIILEVEVPNYFFPNVDPSMRFGTLNWGTIERKLFKDISTFIRRVGIGESVSTDGNIKRTWYSLEEAKEIGFGMQHFQN